MKFLNGCPLLFNERCSPEEVVKGGWLGLVSACGVSSVMVGEPTSLEIIKPATGSYITQMSLRHQFQPCQKPPVTNHCRRPLKGIFMNWIRYFIPWCILYGVTSRSKWMNTGIESESWSLQVFVYLVQSNWILFVSPRLRFCLTRTAVFASI